MSATDKVQTKEREQQMPVRALPMPPVKLQRPDSSGGVAFTRPQTDVPLPVPQLVLKIH